MVDGAHTLNMQINFYVMRTLWQIIIRRSKNDTIHDTFNMSRTRYNKVLDGDNIRMSTNEMVWLCKLTGISSDIFEGKDRFEIAHITEKQWETFFGLTKNSVDYYNQRKIINDRIKDEYRYSKNKMGQFLMLCKFIENIKDDKSIKADLILSKQIEELNKIKLKMFSGVNEDILYKYIEALELQLKFANTMSTIIKHLNK